MKIRSAHLTGAEPLEFDDFNVVVGGNSVGKTTFLMELFHRSRELTRPRWFWLDQQPLEYLIQDPLVDLRLLAGSMTSRWEGPNRYFYSQATRNLEGNPDLDGRYRFSKDEGDSIAQALAAADGQRASQLLTSMKLLVPFVSLVSCEARLNVTNHAALNSLAQPPSDALNVLYRNTHIRDEITAAVQSQFGLRLSLLDHARSELDLGLSPQAPPAFDVAAVDLQEEYSRIERWKELNFMPFQDVGHGIRSLVKVLMSLLEPVHQVILIDEPEMHVYPAQKRWLGRQLVSFARLRGKQVFIVTHDPIVLQGILDSPGQTRVFRLDFQEDRTRVIRVCDLHHLEEVGARRNQDSYLQSLFYQRVIAVEGATDRAFYQTMIEELLPDMIADKDLGLVSSGGKGASKNVAFIASKVRLRSAFIYDFDALLTDAAIMRDIISLLGGEAAPIERVVQLHQANFGADSSAIAQGTKDATLRGLDSAYVQAHPEEFRAAMAELAEHGVFLVPRGALESWAPSVENKARFAEIAPDVIKADPTLREPLAAFLTDILRFLGC